eukprot:TRINITY_DN8407_c0_g1_i1.p1 TRINITY_DN8407_c0_g1~~TRINITY_DN8407_c0_g1_i1.p1  ORF type:complete len:830 (+),score=216.11 TRINITY_DN8407_c0_g1_i1:335-2491(+)
MRAEMEGLLDEETTKMCWESYKRKPRTFADQLVLHANKAAAFKREIDMLSNQLQAGERMFIDIEKRRKEEEEQRNNKIVAIRTENQKRRARLAEKMEAKNRIKGRKIDFVSLRMTCRELKEVADSCFPFKRYLPDMFNAISLRKMESVSLFLRFGKFGAFDYPDFESLERNDVATKSVKENKRETDMRDRLNEAMKRGKQVWVSYDGGADPLEPRMIIPRGWDPENSDNVMAQCNATVYKQFRFTVGKIVEMRDECWELEDSDSDDDDDDAVVERSTKRDHSAQMIHMLVEDGRMIPNCHRLLLNCLDREDYSPFKAMMKSDKFRVSHDHLQHAVMHKNLDLFLLLLQEERREPNLDLNRTMKMCLSLKDPQFFEAIVGSQGVDLAKLEDNNPFLNVQSIEIAKFLLSIEKLDPSINNNEALSNAIQFKRNDIVKLLLDDKRTNISSNSSLILHARSKQMYDLLIEDGRVDVTKASKLLLGEHVWQDKEWAASIYTNPKVNLSLDGDKLFHSLYEILPMPLVKETAMKYMLRCTQVDPSSRDNLAICSVAFEALEVTKIILSHSRFNPKINSEMVIETIVKTNRIELIQVLFKKLDPSLHDSLGLREACQRYNIKMNIVDFFLSFGKVDPSSNSNQVLKLAVEKGEVELVKRLLKDSRVDPNAAVSRIPSAQIADIVFAHPKITLTSEEQTKIKSKLPATTGDKEEPKPKRAKHREYF